MRVFKTDIGLSFNVKQDKCCVFCEHCTDIFYDSNGPYIIDCEKSSEYADDHNSDGKCELFEDEYAIRKSMLASLYGSGTDIDS